MSSVLPELMVWHWARRLSSTAHREQLHAVAYLSTIKSARQYAKDNTLNGTKPMIWTLKYL